MKKVLATLLAICMIMAFVPAISFAADSTTNAVRTAFFNSNGSEWTSTHNDYGGTSILVSAGADGWTSPNSFTDTDGTVTTQTSLSGTGFSSARNGLVSFTIPADLDTSNVAKVTLSLTVNAVKQTTAGIRLGVYGNSIDGTWSVGSTQKSVFGVSGSDSGLGNLELLGLTSALSVGNQTGDYVANETVTLTSNKLTSYVCEMADAGKSEVTFRLAVPLGGLWIYGATSTTPPTLKIEEGKVVSVPVEAVYGEDGTEVLKAVGNVIEGSTFTYADAITNAVDYNGATYVYNSEKSTLSVTADGTSKIILYYDKFDESQIFSGYEIEDEGAWCWFADPRSITYTNEAGTLDFSIIGYIDIHGSIKATQINHLTDEVNEVLIRTNIQPDDHNNPTFLVLPDERIIVFYSRHTDEACFWYRVTKQPGDLTTLGEEKCLNTSANTTYPSPFLMENDPDHIYLMWRGINWHPTIAKLSLPDEDGNTAFTYGPYQMVQSTGARPYAKYASNGVDKLYVTYTTGHPDNEQPNWVYFNQINIEDMTLEDINGRTMSTIANGVLNVNKTDAGQTHIVDTAPGNMRDWVWQTAVGDDGKPVIAMVRIDGGKTSHDYYYVKWNGTEWVATFLANGGGHFHQTPGLEMCYSGGMLIDPDNTNVMYCSVPVDGAFGEVYEIIKYTMNDEGTAVAETEAITKNSRLNNVRPFVLPESEGKDIRLTWMYGNYYDWIVSKEHTTAYGTAVHAEAPLPAKTVDLTDAAVVEDYSSIGGAFKATSETANLVEAQSAGEFTVNAEILLEGEYEGTLLDLGDVKLSVQNMETQYGATQTGNRARVVVTVDGTEYVTSNVYGSSDCWTTYNRGTGGNYGVENYNGYITHTITYDGEKLTVYREGLVDITIPASSLSFDNIKVGGFDGLADDVAVYDRVLNRDEIRALADVAKAVEEPDGEGTDEIVKNFVDIEGNIIKTAETITLNKGTHIYNFTPDETVDTGDFVYALVDSDGDYDISDGSVTAVYVKSKAYGENIVTNGSFEDENGDFSLVGWNSAQTLAQFGSPYTTDHCYAVNATEAINNGASSALTTDIPDGNWAFGTRWNDGAAGLCSLMRYVPVESGKTYEISFKVKHKFENVDAGYVRISLVDQIYNSNDANSVEKNIETPGIVGTEWKTYTRTFTATDATDHVLFWFRWLGNGYEGQGPYWFFDDFRIREISDVVSANVTVDGVDKIVYGSLELGNEGELPENVTGYRITSSGSTRFVPAGTYDVVDGDVIETINVNVAPVMGAQVRYGGGLDENGKISAGNGIRFIAEVDRSNAGDEIVGYGMKITAEASEKFVEVDAEKYQNADETIFTTAVTNLEVSNYNRKFTATPYVKVQYEDGNIVKIYAQNDITRSIYQVAAGLLKNENSDNVDGGDAEYSADAAGLYDVLNAYVNMVGIRLTTNGDEFGARTDGAGAYSGDVFFDVAAVKVSDGVYTVTVTPLDSFNKTVKIMNYWDEFVRINNNHSEVVTMISESEINADGSVTFTFTMK